MLSRETGHSRVPAPPHMMTGMIVLGIMNLLGYLQSPVIRWMAATLDGIVEGNGAVFEAKFMLS
jgi:hypothetical protein